MTIAIVNGQIVTVGSEDAARFLDQQVNISEQVRVSSIKAAVAERIVSVAPMEMQQNLLAHRLDVMSRRLAGEVISANDVALEAHAVDVAQKITVLRKTGHDAIAAGADPRDMVWLF